MRAALRTCRARARVATGALGASVAVVCWLGLGPAVASDRLFSGDYLPPKVGADVLPTETFAAPTERVFADLGRRVRDMDLAVSSEDGASGVIVARYSGPTEDFIDCGTFAAASAEVAGSTAGIATLELEAAPETGGSGYEQLFRLDTRHLALVEARGQASAVVVFGTYVVRREQRVLDADGGLVEERIEFIDFVSGSSARFDDGVACAATGSLETSILQLELDAPS